MIVIKDPTGQDKVGRDVGFEEGHEVG